ncbi:uncharacterized protein LOC114575405 [Exaiptasia diaphana]|uniref:Homeobox domain-containing protein n=1 Tax=Exaiptasia diaphana TaxID=2652724 RepID=A0A913YKN2_EXADI|nr:uncharacterized protein LOC114575405 [Exaiptasia diaphana]
MPLSLDEEKSKMLLQFWKDGMTSTKSSCEELIENAAQASGLSETQVKNWIGNERKRLGLCRKRGPRPQKEGNKVPCKTRKKSAYQLFKSDFLKSDTARQLRKGFSDGEVQRRGNAVWRNIGVGERQRWEELAEEENMNPPQKEETKISRAKKLSSHIRTCIDQLDQLGYPSMWLGLINGVPERHISVKIKEMAEDETITNYVLSAIVKITAKEKMAAESHIEGDKGQSKKSKKRAKKKRRKQILLLKTPMLWRRVDTVLSMTPLLPVPVLCRSPKLWLVLCCYWTKKDKRLWQRERRSPIASRFMEGP